jgi:hypothetical protein
VGRLEQLGYLNCTAVNDETHTKCERKPGNFSWLDYAWEGGVQRPVSAAARAVSWWLGEGDTAGDAFDADTFLELLSRLSLDSREPVLAQRRPATLVIVGDSTARQQAVSLCCLLRAGVAAAGSPFTVEVTVNYAFLTFACQVARRDAAPGAAVIVAKIRYVRCNRGNTLPPWRPLERSPVLDKELAHAIAKTPDVLILNLGAWTFEDGCEDKHSLHDALCNGTRPWVLHEYATLWTLLAGALNAAYNPQKRRRSVVMLRTASPRDYEGGKHPVGTCRRTAPIPEGELVEEEERVDIGGMRVSVLTKNLILDAVAAQRMPWVRVLDAYEISRARADAHPGRFVLRPPSPLFCTRYCELYSQRLNPAEHVRAPPTLLRPLSPPPSNPIYTRSPTPSPISNRNSYAAPLVLPPCPLAFVPSTLPRAIAPSTPTSR